jgi:hypothetical protein
MSRNFRSIRSSCFLRSAYLVWALLAIVYVLFEVPDVDGSNLPRLLTPLHRSALMAESNADGAGDGQESEDQRRHGLTLSVGAPQRFRLPVQTQSIAPRLAASSVLDVIAPARRETPSCKARQTTSKLIASR